MQAGSTGKVMNLLDAMEAYGICSAFCATSGAERAHVSISNKKIIPERICISKIPLKSWPSLLQPATRRNQKKHPPRCPNQPPDQMGLGFLHFSGRGSLGIGDSHGLLHLAGIGAHFHGHDK